MKQPAVRPQRDRAPTHGENVRVLAAYALYGVALFVSAVTTFGAAGVLPGLLIPAAWCYIFLSRPREKALVHVIIAIALLGGIVAVVLPTTQQAREAARRTACKNNLKQISLALHNYHDAHGSFPPAYLADANGRRMHSWRVLLLPYLDGEALYSAYNFDEPWDSPGNLKLLSRMPDVYACPSSFSDEHGDEGYTTYVGVVGEGTAWPGPGARRIREMRDGTSNTVHVIEYDSGGKIHWTEPRDLDFDEAVSILGADDSQWTTGHRNQTFFRDTWYGGRHVAFADGGVRYVGVGLEGQVWLSLLNVDDGGPMAEWDVGGRHFSPVTRLRIGNCCRFAVFVLLVLFPLPWVWMNPTGEVRGGSEPEKRRERWRPEVRR